MTPEKQKIAIAKACGWTALRYIGTDLFGQPNKHIPVSIDDEVRLVPNYPKDLNAMHEVCLTMESHQRVYLNYLCQIMHVDGKDIRSHRETFRLLNATAAQRAEAFLRTLNLWENE